MNKCQLCHGEMPEAETYTMWIKDKRKMMTICQDCLDTITIDPQ